MEWIWIIALIVLVLGSGLLFESWRVGRVENWAKRHGFERLGMLAPELEKVLRQSHEGIDPQQIRQFGFVLAGRFLNSRIYMSEVRLPAFASITSKDKWFTLVTVELPESFDESALRAALPVSSAALQVALQGREIVLRRSGLLLPTRLDAVLAEISRALQTLSATKMPGSSIR